MNTENISIRQALHCDIPQIVELLKFVASESNGASQFDEHHSWEHVTGIVCNGVSFIAVLGDEIVGVIMCSYVNMGFVQTTHLETAHLYVLPSARNTRATANLLTAVEDYADRHEVVLILHQMDYQSAIYGGENNSLRVERLFRFRGYKGPVDTATVGPEQRRVGVSYRYVGVEKGATNN